MSGEMTPKEFATKMQSIVIGGDVEITHGNADDLVYELLIQLGYAEGAEIYKDACDTRFWYA